ncbi:hypothetical protein LXD69_02910 [Flavobacterium sediminilitoris]|uniref:Flap endonuclease-1-like 5' DNA nuclease n=1 Tax=Flavobacterium sediminilitoris TaxID=2024526 RepID=A0ABY4HNN9_9FLAO|nr:MULTISPECIES: hypothetical protein [Flavobacterium]UOX34468.1 hypothetical protein LXD69_02910 [Flavobacterium sediminilitoris]
MNLPCFLIPALVGIICGILGYLLGKNFSKQNEDYDSIKDDLDSCNRRNSQLRLDMDKLRSQMGEISNNKRSSFTESISKPTILPFNAEAVKEVFGKKINENDLKIIEGIGPKIEELFKTSGILTWKSLSETSVDRCKEILLKAGERFQIHDPGTWPRQAKLCYEGKWLELKDWQEILDGGRER